MHILILGGISRSLINFRGPLIRAMLAAGHKVTACAGTPVPEAEQTLAEWGVQFIPVPLARAGMNPLGDIQTFRALRRIMRQERPDAVLAYTIKPVIWGGLAAHSAGIHNLHSLITGLGYAFIGGTSAKQRLASWLAKRLYKASLKHSRKVFFQNPDDAHEFIQRKLVAPHQTVVVSGSGIDLAHFGDAKRETRNAKPTADDQQPTSPPLPTANCQLPPHTHPHTHTPTHSTSFLLVARLLRDKGICEYAEAAAIIKRDHPTAEFHLVGDYDPNPSGLKPADVDAWVNAGTILYHGPQPDVRPFLQACSVYVLPSYREGTPRTVLEAMATGRPIITTDAPGCRETIRFQTTDPGVQTADYRLQTADQASLLTSPRRSTAWSPSPVTSHPPQPRTKNLRIGENGILIPPRDPEALAKAMRFFIDHPDQIASMGRASRQYTEERYDVHKVNAVMLREMGL